MRLPGAGFSRAMGLTLLTLATLSACDEPTRRPVDPQPMIDPCLGVPELTLSSTSTALKVNAPADVSARGGSGHFRYTLSTNESGGSLSGTRYVAGPTPGSDVITAADECGHSATVTIAVTGAFTVTPVRGVLRPDANFQIRVTGAIGTPTFTAPSGLKSGGTLSPTGQYRAGASAGTDVIVVTDPATGDQVAATYAVSADAALKGRPGVIALPTGASVTLQSLNGTGEMSWVLTSGLGELSGATYTAPAEPPANPNVVITGRDLFTMETTTVRLQILTELTRPTRAQGRRTDQATMVSADFNGDGYADLAVGAPESDLKRPQGGAVFIYLGSMNGLSDHPDYTLYGDSDTAQLGAVLAAGDLDGDGKADLAISEPGADVTISDSGAVLLYAFTADGPQPMRPALTGLGRGNYGAALAVADIDNDGDNDLLVGSPGADLTGGSFNTRGVVDLYLLQRGQPIPDLGSLRIGGVDMNTDGTLRPFSTLRSGRGLLVADFNTDGKADLAIISSVNNSLIQGVAAARVQITAAVYFGRGGAKPFEDTPDLFVLPDNAADSFEGTWRLGFIPASGSVPPLLGMFADQTDSPNLADAGGTASGSNSGGVMLFDLTAIHPTGPASSSPQQLGRVDAWARVYGDVGGVKAGISFTSTDLDGDGTRELLLGAPNATVTVRTDAGTTISTGLAGKVLVYPLSALSRGAIVNKPAATRDGTGVTDMMGTAMTFIETAGFKTLALYCSRATTTEGDFTGRLDIIRGNGALAGWARSSIATPAKPGGEGFGTAVDVGIANGKVVAAVNSPTFSAPGPVNSGSDTNAGKVTGFTPSQTNSAAVVIVGANQSYTLDSGVRAFGGIPVGADVAFTDFDGDGHDELVVGAQVLATPTSLPDGGSASTTYARNVLACMPQTQQSNGGALMFSPKADGTWPWSFAAWQLKDIVGCTVPDGGAAALCQRSAIGKTLVGHLDFNGDGKQDVMATRNNGIEVLLGQASDDATLARPTMSCNGGFTLPFSSPNPFAPAALGDLDNDGCDEVFARYSDGSNRQGFFVVFGFDATGTRCGGRTQPAWLRVSGDNETGLILMRLGIAGARAGKLLKGDSRDFIAVTADSYPFEGTAQSTVLLFDSAELVAKRPAQGERLVSMLNDGLTPIPMVPQVKATGFGRAMAGGADLTGDLVPDLVVSAPGASVNGDGNGAVFIFAGGSVVPGRNEPAGLVLSDDQERANFGVDLGVVKKSATTPASLVVGAPLSYRAGTSNGTAYSASF